MVLVGLLGHSMATGHSGASVTWAPGHSVAGHLVAGAFGSRKDVFGQCSELAGISLNLFYNISISFKFFHFYLRKR